MEKLKKQRTPIRTMITRIINESEMELALENITILTLNGKYEKLSGLLQQIQLLDQQILDKMADDDNLDEIIYQTEVDAVQEYIDKVIMMKLKIDDFIYSNNEKNRVPSGSATSVYETPVCSKRQLKLPKIELNKFSGKIIDWLGWWSQFKKIDGDTELHATDKFQYLKQSMEPKTRGYEIVHSFPASEQNYPKAIAALKERFGKKKLLTQVYIRELFQMGLKNLNKKVEITTMYDTLICHIRVLESLEITLEQSTLFLYPMVESSLPEDTLIAWQRSNLYEKDGSLETPPKGELNFLLQFLQQEVERQEQRSLLKSGFEISGTTNHNYGTAKKKESNTPTAANLFNGQSKTSSCIFCERNHESKDCGKIENWSFDDMKKKIHEKKCCSKCLRPNHVTAKCRTFVKCHVCSQPHVTIMCPELKKMKHASVKEISSSAAIAITENVPSFNGANFDVSGDVLLKTLMAYVSTKDNKHNKLVRILFDDGCQRSCITKSTIESIHSTPIGTERSRNILFDGSKTNYQTSNIHEISIFSIDKSKEIQLILPKHYKQITRK